jgi:hypothetical protein
MNPKSTILSLWKKGADRCRLYIAPFQDPGDLFG